MNFPVYEGVHEAIIAEEDWELAQEKRSKNNYRREKIHDPEHAHILSGILKCPCCGKGMYGNIAKAGRKDNKTRYYYYCKNTVNAQMKLKPLWFGLFLILTGKGIDPEYKDADMDYEVTRSDIKILKQIHSLGDAQYKRLMAYMKALQKLEQMENMVEE